MGSNGQKHITQSGPTWDSCPQMRTRRLENMLLDTKDYFNGHGAAYDVGDSAASGVAQQYTVRCTTADNIPIRATFKGYN